MARKVIMKYLPTNIPDLAELWNICFLTKGTKITLGLTIDNRKFYPRFMLHMEFLFFNIKIIHVFNSTFVDICSATSYLFGFPSRRKWPPSDIIKLIFTKLRNKDNKVLFIQVDKYGPLARYSDFMRKYNNINIIVQTTGGGESYPNG